MRPRFLIFIFFAVLLIAALLLWRRPAQPGTKTEQPAAVGQPSSPTASSTSHVSAVAPFNQPNVQSNFPSITTNSDAKKQLIIEQEISGKNSPIDFYGLVIDQNNKPIPGVKIKSGVRHWKMFGPEFGYVGSTTITLEATTGMDGRFELTGASGDVFGVLLTKDGYDAEPGNSGFGAGSYSYANPIIFKMWSNNIHEQLITGNKSFQIVTDGRPYFINLTDDTIHESGTGDLKVWIRYTNQIAVTGQRYDWSAGIVVVNGGLKAATDNAMWMAPTDGYVPSFQLTGKVRGGQRGQIGERRFYLQLQNGSEYGHMTINLLAPFNIGIPGLVQISYAINPSGSRILR